MIYIPDEMVQKELQSHFGNVNETPFTLLCVWSAGKGPTWEALLDALRAAELNAQANRLQEWGESGAASVRCTVMIQGYTAVGVTCCWSTLVWSCSGSGACSPA